MLNNELVPHDERLLHEKRESINMNNYYGATCLVGLLLNKQEYTEFEAKYETICKPIMDDEEKEEFADLCHVSYNLQNEGISYDDYMFIKSHVALKTIAENKPVPDESRLYRFIIQCICKEKSNNMAFTPMNLWGSNNYKPKSVRDCNNYVVWCTKPIGLQAFRGHKTCNSKEELINEFKYTLAAYLPDNFDWESHIGSFDFAHM